MSAAPRRAWITGASRGIGAGIARALAAAGWHCLLTSRPSRDLDAVAAATGGDALPADVADPAQIAALEPALGDDLDLLVLSAGIGVFGPLASCPIADLDRLHAVNVRGTLRCCQAALPRLRRRCGAVIGIGSIMSVQTYRDQGAYAASKHAMLALLKTLAKEEARHGVRVAAVLPGGVDTDMVRQSRPDLDPAGLIRVEDVARAVLHAVETPASCWVDEIRLRRAGAEPFAAG